MPDHRNVGVAIVDENLRFISINPALASMNGIPLHFHYGKQLRSVVGSAARQIEPALEKVLESGHSLLNFELRAKLPGRKELAHFIETFVPLNGKGRGVRAVAALVVELTPNFRNASRALIEGYLVAPEAALNCLGQSEKAIREQARQLLQPRWAPSLLRACRNPKLRPCRADPVLFRNAEIPDASELPLDGKPIKLY